MYLLNSNTLFTQTLTANLIMIVIEPIFLLGKGKSGAWEVIPGWAVKKFPSIISLIIASLLHLYVYTVQNTKFASLQIMYPFHTLVSMATKVTTIKISIRWLYILYNFVLPFTYFTCTIPFTHALLSSLILSFVLYISLLKTYFRFILTSSIHFQPIIRHIAHNEMLHILCIFTDSNHPYMWIHTCVKRHNIVIMIPFSTSCTMLSVNYFPYTVSPAYYYCVHSTITVYSFILHFK